MTQTQEMELSWLMYNFLDQFLSFFLKLIEEFKLNLDLTTDVLKIAQILILFEPLKILY